MGYKVKTRKMKSKRSSVKRSSTKRTNKKRHTNKKRRTGKTKRTFKMRGGNYANYPAAAYGPLMPGNGLDQLGPAYDATVKGFPTGNHLPYNMNVLRAPAPSNPQVGGKKHKHKNNKKQRGGGFSSFISSIVPLEPLNIVRSVPASLGHVFDKFNGDISSPSSMVYPTQQPLVEPVNKLSISTPVNIKSIYDGANMHVMKL